MNRQPYPSQRHQRGQRFEQDRSQRARSYERHDEPDNFQQFADDLFDAREADRYPHGYSRARSAPWAEPYRYGYPDAPRQDVPRYGASHGYSGNREGPYGADQRPFDHSRSEPRDWGREGQRYDQRHEQPQGWRSHAYDDGSYLGNAQRSARYGNERSWDNDDPRRMAGDGSTVSRLSSYGFYDTGTAENRYGRQTPKGYTRSDERIKDDVCGHLYHANDIDLSEVTIESKNGTVILEGTVPDRRMKHRIEDIAEQCIGVNDVENRIRVSRDSGNQQARGSGGNEERSSGNRNPASTPNARH
ncbi:MAG TPA: BON domain-containing protein [Fontimonas sp.]